MNRLNNFVTAVVIFLMVLSPKSYAAEIYDTKLLVRQTVQGLKPFRTFKEFIADLKITDKQSAEEFDSYLRKNQLEGANIPSFIVDGTTVYLSQNRDIQMTFLDDLSVMVTWPGGKRLLLPSMTVSQRIREFEKTSKSSSFFDSVFISSAHAVLQLAAFFIAAGLIGSLAYVRNGRTNAAEYLTYHVQELGSLCAQGSHMTVSLEDLVETYNTLSEVSGRHCPGEGGTRIWTACREVRPTFECLRTKINEAQKSSNVDRSSTQRVEHVPRNDTYRILPGGSRQ